MFGISWTEFLVILIVAILVLPARMWPDVARFLAQVVKFVRRLIWKITDASENIRNQIDLEQPIDEIIHATTDDVLAEFSTVIPKAKRARAVKKKAAKK
ncbi:MAG: hypothetical protein IJD52_02620 [Alphaproteobacteria bacterium]|nr:hypothetical protein [Alphaproteobacteria bacterium]